VLEVHASIAQDASHFRQLLVFLVHNFRSNHSLLEKYVQNSYSCSCVIFPLFTRATVLVYFFGMKMITEQLISESGVVC